MTECVLATISMGICRLVRELQEKDMHLAVLALLHRFYCFKNSHGVSLDTGAACVNSLHFTPLNLEAKRKPIGCRRVRASGIGV